MRNLSLLSVVAIPFIWVSNSVAEPFTGSIVFEQSAMGGAGEKMFKDLAPGKITVHIAPHAYRQDEVGGMNEGSFVIKNGSTSALMLNTNKKTSTLGGAANIDSYKEEVRKFMVHHFKTELEATDETLEIAGHQTKKYKVLKSAFVKPDAVAHIWVAEDIDFSGHRYDFQFPNNRTTAPLPMSIPVEKGSVLKMVVLENGTTVTVVATRITPGNPDPALFTKPTDYQGADFPEPPKEMEKPTGPIADVSKLAASVTNGIGMKLVLVKPGEFLMGSSEDEPNRHDNETQHQVKITRPYYIATTEVTQSQWKAVMGVDSPSNFKGDDLPVEKITWQQAQDFCQQLSKKEGKNYRLPTEAEWEYAARAGETVDFKPMKTSERKAWIAERAWFYDNAKYKTHPVGQLKANAWGLYDVLGNVEEWTSSGIGKYPQGPVIDPQGFVSDNKVVRGSGWISSYDWIRPAARMNQPADKEKSTIGMRVVYEPSAE
ncbi:MAG: SUMF1/EgtB/PvdO family nonheme iron enzyme [Akkermansiaceae bacterium]|nr:SUMF1/EgtB/PvdO family nonheme iron enzyme [Akkermansiaceae bacterium]